MAVAGRALLIEGPSGSGKSSLALEMMARGADLISDDQTLLTRQGNRLVADAPTAIRGLIEARGLGLLKVEPAGPSPVIALLDLAHPETDRLPPIRKIVVLSIPLILFNNSLSPYLAAGLVQFLKGNLHGL